MTREAGRERSREETSACSPPALDTRPSLPLSLPTNFSVPRAKSPPRIRPETQWNTANLPWRVGSDIGAAACAGALVAPIITVIDRGVIENASGRSTLGQSVSRSLWNLLSRPHTILLTRPFALIFMVYSSTYITANTIDTASSTFTNSPAASTTAGLPKFAATSTVNMSLGLFKDSQFAKMFGPKNPSVKRVIPRPTYALFALRDSMTIFASFNVPPVLAPLLPLSHEVEKTCSRACVAQFLAPAAVQILSTPLHLLGLDLYNRNGRLGWAARWEKVRVDWAMSSLARMCRIVPAFGVGGVVNASVRKSLLGRLEER